MRCNSVVVSLIFGLVSLLFGANGESPYIKEKPPYVLTCRINEPEFTKCSTKSIQGLLDEVLAKDGLPGLSTLPPLDPLYINKLKVNQAGTQAINLKVELSNLKITGFRKVKVTESQVSPKDYHWETKVYLPEMGIYGNYAMQGRILLINLNGHGNISIILDKLSIIMYTKTRLYEKGGFTFYNVTSTKTKYMVESLKVRLDNLFNGNKELEDSTNVFFNENWRTLNEALQPLIQTAIAEVLTKYLGTIFHYIPANFFVENIPTPKELYGE